MRVEVVIDVALGAAGVAAAPRRGRPTRAARAGLRPRVPVDGERIIRVTERSREELGRAFVRRDPFIRSYTKQTGVFRKAFMQRENPR